MNKCVCMGGTQILMQCNIFIVYLKDEGCSVNTSVTADICGVKKLATYLRAENFISSIRMRVNLKVTTLH
jgi:hypothetical protein